MAGDTRRADERERSTSRPPVVIAGGFSLGRIGGVDVRVDWSLLIIFALIAGSLGLSVFPSWHPDWSPLMRWIVALLAAVAFFASVLAHEMSHAIVGNWQGIPIKGITLFLFGGLAHMEKQPPSPKSELLMAIVGPLTSFVIGAGCSLLAWALIGPGHAELFSVDPERAIALLGPGESILLWLGPVNLILAIFNLVPGFPLDGGRVFRAVMWWVTGDMKKATRIASGTGRGLAILLMVMGAAMALGLYLPFFGVGLGPGLWLILIGWFLYKAAKLGYEQLIIREALRDVRVSQLMRRHFEYVTPDVTLDELIHHHAMQSDQQSFPVVEDGRLVGVVSARDAMRVPYQHWSMHTVKSIMGPPGHTVRPDEEVTEAMRELEADQVLELPVVKRDGEVTGVLRRQDIFKWLMLRSDELSAGA